MPGGAPDPQGKVIRQPPPPMPNGRSPISDLSTLADRAMAETDRYRSEPYRKHREAWVLGRFSSVYNVGVEVSRQLSLAEPGDSISIPADFAVFDATGAYVADLEITELTDMWEWYRDGTDIPEIANPWACLPGLLRKKFKKSSRYRNPTWLIVYDNAISGIFTELNGVSFGAADVGRSLAGRWPSQLNITAIWILSSDGRQAERVYPTTTLPDTVGPRGPKGK